MKSFNNLPKFFLISILFLSLSSCDKSSDTNIDPITEASKNLIGNWVSYKVLENNVDITSLSSGSFVFNSDKTFTGVAIEQGFTFPTFGTWEIKENGKTLTLVSNLSGSVDYILIKITDNDLVLQYLINNFTRVVSLKKV